MSSLAPFSTSSESATGFGHRGVPRAEVACAKTTFAKGPDGRSPMLRGRPARTPRPGTRSGELRSDALVRYGTSRFSTEKGGGESEENRARHIEYRGQRESRSYHA